MTLLTIQGLTVELQVDRQARTILRDVSLDIPEAGSLGLVGESGCGKSMTARAITRQLPDSATSTGSISFAGVSVQNLSGDGLLDYRRRSVSLIPQDPRASLNPVYTVGDFLTEPLRVVQQMSRDDATAKALGALKEVGISDPLRSFDQYPHELSGGMLQRVIICSAMLAGTRLIIADEPTTALDVTTQAEVMSILNELRIQRGLALLFISHDLELAAAVCDSIAVMYAGEIVESQRAATLDETPIHPYTRALLAARPSIDHRVESLPAIPGRAIAAYEAASGCSFAGRCPWHIPDCDTSHPHLTGHQDGWVRCIRADDVALDQQAGGASHG